MSWTTKHGEFSWKFGEITQKIGTNVGYSSIVSPPFVIKVVARGLETETVIETLETLAAPHDPWFSIDLVNNIGWRWNAMVALHRAMDAWLNELHEVLKKHNNAEGFHADEVIYTLKF